MRSNKPIIVPSHTDNKNMERYLHKKLSEVGEGSGGQGNDPNAVHFTQQSLTEEQKAQARANIGAGTYDKPSSGIPASDLASEVIPDVSGKADKSNKVTSIDAQSTDEQYPSAKAVHGALGKFYTKEEIDALLLPFKIPAEYQLVEYLQGDGVAYIDLGVNNKTTFGVRAKVSNIPSNLKTALAGACNGSNAGCGVQISYGSVKFCAARSSNSVSLQQPGSANGKYVQANFYGSGKGLIEGLEDTTTISPLDSYAYADTNYHFLLFAYNDYQGTTRRCDESDGVRLHHFQLTDGSVLTFDLYPVRRKSDDEPGMYDIVTGTFFPNANSTGAFTVGPNA